MTRFNISLEDGCEMVFFAIQNAWGGEIFVPKIPSYKITDVATAIAPQLKHKIIGLRAGEKLHEEMITSSDSINTLDIGKYYVILPPTTPNSKYSKQEYREKFNGKDVTDGFTYNSGNNNKWETIKTLQNLIKLHIDPNFQS